MISPTINQTSVKQSPAIGSKSRIKSGTDKNRNFSNIRARNHGREGSISTPKILPLREPSKETSLEKLPPLGSMAMQSGNRKSSSLFHADETEKSSIIQDRKSTSNRAPSFRRKIDLNSMKRSKQSSTSKVRN